MDNNSALNASGHEKCQCFLPSFIYVFIYVDDFLFIWHVFATLDNSLRWTVH